MLSLGAVLWPVTRSVGFRDLALLRLEGDEPPSWFLAARSSLGYILHGDERGACC